MFSKLRTVKHLKTVQDENQLSVGFFGRVARIARVHQEGLEDNAAKKGRDIAIRPGLYLDLVLSIKH